MEKLLRDSWLGTGRTEGEEEKGDSEDYTEKKKRLRGGGALYCGGVHDHRRVFELADHPNQRSGFRQSRFSLNHAASKGNTEESKIREYAPPLWRLVPSKEEIPDDAFADSVNRIDFVRVRDRGESVSASLSPQTPWAPCVAGGGIPEEAAPAGPCRARTSPERRATGDNCSWIT